MHILPKTKRGWIELLLIPFMVYVLATPIWLHVWRRATDGFRTRGMWHDERFYLGRWYLLCLAVFFTAGIIQFFSRWRRAALVSFIFAALTFVILFFYLLPVNEAK